MFALRNFDIVKLMALITQESRFTVAMVTVATGGVFNM